MISENIKQQILNSAYGITRNGTKVKYLFTSEINIKNCRHLFIVYREVNGKVLEHFIIWLTEDFKFLLVDREHDFDVVGLWKEKPEPVSNTVTLTLPCPVLQPEINKTYYTPVITDVDGYDPDGKFADITEWVVDDDGGNIDWQSQHRLEEGLVFETKEGVKTWLNAMRNNCR